MITRSSVGDLTRNFDRPRSRPVAARQRAWPAARAPPPAAPGSLTVQRAVRGGRAASGP